MMYSLPFYPHFPPRRYSYYPHSTNTNSSASSKPYSTNRVPNKDFKDLNKKREKYNNVNYHEKQKNNNLKKYNSNYLKNDNNMNFKNQNNIEYPHSTEMDETSEKDDPIFEILGIKLHSDDILLICLIFFLFKEGVQDEYLFISLILLLLS